MIEIDQIKAFHQSRLSKNSFSYRSVGCGSGKRKQAGNRNVILFFDMQWNNLLYILIAFETTVRITIEVNSQKKSDVADPQREFSVSREMNTAASVLFDAAAINQKYG
ncbi:MAG: hypothetical protein C4527_21245 [Candidatus Omnitrophota bacterium]|jgi:hypothetical protein|nr:MAG: hypothetical protein C4527_21245 [Candidatus Omnitrophota bacterium]